jgi:hypothetical protein
LACPVGVPTCVWAVIAMKSSGNSVDVVRNPFPFSNSQQGCAKMTLRL